MRPVDDKECYNYGSAQEGYTGNAANKARHNRKVLASRAKPMPSKWDDAQKWLVGLSNGSVDRNHSKAKPRNSNADDRRLLSSSSQNGRVSCSSVDGALEYNLALAVVAPPEEGETKKIDCEEPHWKAINPVQDSPVSVRSVCLRDMGTEMTPIASKEPSRTGTPLRASTPVMRTPISSRSSTPGRRHQEGQAHEGNPAGARSSERTVEPVPFGRANGNGWPGPARAEGEMDGGLKIPESNVPENVPNPNSLESRAAAWDEAERAKFMARYKREEVKIQAWENHEKRKVEMEMKKMEIKAEQMKARAQEKMANKLAATRRMAEEKRASAEAKLNERAARTSEKADYIRRTGHLPSSFFSFKLPSLCG